MNDYKLQGTFLAKTKDVVLVANKTTLQAFTLKDFKLKSQYKLSFRIV